MEVRGMAAGTRRADWLVERLRGSNRLIVIDNAHRMTRSALAWIFDFSDPVEAGGTGCPVALVGNPELLEKIAAKDQQFSRVGVLRPLKLTGARALADAMLQRLCPAHAGALLDLAERVVTERGHLRALKKHLLLMPEFLGAAGGDPRKAFLMAHTQVVSNYKLED
jgi:DNA transposition AAA+ family ATPase